MTLKKGECGVRPYLNRVVRYRKRVLILPDLICVPRVETQRGWEVV